MEKLKINIENCYGITKLDCEFDFRTKNVLLLYASNGVMKTSFAKACDDYSQGKPSRDRYNPSAIPVCSIIESTTSSLLQPSVLRIIRTYKRGYQNNPSVAKLLASEELKAEYDIVIKDIDEKKKVLTSLLRDLVGKRSDADLEATVAEALGKSDFSASVLDVRESLTDDYRSDINDIKLTEVFNKDVEAFLGKPNVRASLKLYQEKYHAIIENSRTFREGFDHHGAETVNTAMKKSKFFQAGHHLMLCGSEEIENVEQLDEVVKRETSAILASDEMKDIFKTVDDDIKKNETLLSFKSFIELHPFLIDEFTNLAELKKNFILSYLSRFQSEVNTYCDSMIQASDKINSIIQRANAQKTDWERVITIFNERFDVPFRVGVGNRTDVLYKGVIPSVTFTNKSTETLIDRKELEGANESDDSLLSQGELRALYLMNVIFDIEARKNTSEETLYIIDDIADSFDYQNKYAIIEYLDDIALYPNTYMVIMTHNYDFYRTVFSRIICRRNRGQAKFAIRDEASREIKIDNLIYLNNPFTTWIKALNVISNLIACIAFVRNLIEYARGTKNRDYLSLTFLLHYKAGVTDTYTVSDLYDLFIRHTDCSPRPTLSGCVYPQILAEADRISMYESSSTNLEYKIVVAIATRLIADKYMIHRLGAPSLKGGNQTRELYDLFKNSLSNDAALSTLHKVMLMTPENIHVNSFMYEPLIDLGMKQLIDLYGMVKAL
ncbi:MAG: hypothetical protein M0Q19_06755 [Candidatus Cloacimonetes bacterium]|jgi:hypothetical protein|nr:hypothetical protein [Candidatus Cloacimonadota bacterium]MCK9332858.1 hypothetical protein [Candidatus Cloacimonadota bacterium]MDD2684276.1 hypothetical protein [Candidatus Cloacimonadota bacterium]